MKRVALIGFWHETNTFNPNPTTSDQFESHAAFWGEEVFSVSQSFGELTGASGGLAGANGEITVVPIGFYWGGVGGRVEECLVTAFESRMLSSLSDASPIDGVLMLLHGASASEGTDDLEGRLLVAVRNAVGSAKPIGVSLDHHANITRAMVGASTFIIGHRTEPHRPDDTARSAGELLVDLLNGRKPVALGWQKLPMVTHQELFETAAGPMNDWFSLAREAETRAGVLAVSPFPVQPWLDVPELGWAVTVVAESPDLANEVACSISEHAWKQRGQFIQRHSVGYEDAVRHIRAAPRSLVLLHDMGDSFYAGSTGTSSFILERLLEEDLGRTCLVPLVAPTAVGLAHASGAGRSIDVELGSEQPMRQNKALVVRAQVIGLDSGPARVQGLLGKSWIDEGRTALLKKGNVLIHVTEKGGIAGADRAAYTRYGIEIPANPVAVVKMAAAYPGFVADDTVRIQVDTPGYSQSDLCAFEWRRAPRPLFGLDSDVIWSRRDDNV